MTTALLLALCVGLALGVLGGGGSILMLPILIHTLGLQAKPAIASSLLVVAVASVAAGTGHALRGRVAWGVVALFSSASAAAAFVGGRLAQGLSAALLLAGFTCVMLIAGLAMLRRAPAKSQRARRPLHALAAGVGVGLVTGTVGAGGGFLVVPALTMFAGLEMSHAVGTSLFIIALNSLAGFAGYAGHVALDWQQLGLVALVAAAGSILGAMVAARIAPAQLRRTFGVLVVANAMWLGIQQWPAGVTTMLALWPRTRMTFEMPWTALLGGALIGLSASLLLAINGRIAGISGILAGVLGPTTGDVGWRVWFLGGLLAGGLLLRLLQPEVLGTAMAPAGLLALSGLLVGFGTRLGGGCTSGHGVCGTSRFSPRSLAATATFMTTGVFATYVLRHVIGIVGTP